MSHPVFRFTAADGQVYVQVTQTPVPVRDSPVGARMAVLYDPEVPTRLRLPADVAAGAGIGPPISAVLAAGLFLLGCFSRRIARRLR